MEIGFGKLRITLANELAPW